MATSNGTSTFLEDGNGTTQVTHEVLAIVSHDLRNPLTTIAMAAALLDGEHSAEERCRMTAAIQRAARIIDRLTRDLLEVSTLEAGRTLRVDLERVDIAALVRDLTDDFAAEAAAKDRRLDVRIDARLPPVEADVDRVRQVLANLIGNALKFTRPGGTVVVSAKADPEGVRCTVTDDGPGMAPEAVARLFDPFWQARETRKLGCGLGLKIAKTIVEAHGSRLDVVSEPGVGTSFGFTLRRTGNGAA